MSNLSEINHYPEDIDVSDTEAQEEAKLVVRENKIDDVIIIDPPPELKDNSQPWWNELMQFKEEPNAASEDEKGSDSDQDSDVIVSERHAQKRQVVFKKVRKERPVRENVTVYANKSRDPQTYFDAPSHQCKNKCWTKFEREEIVGFRSRWWYHGVTANQIFKAEVLTSEASGRILLNNTPCCVKCACWILCVSISQLYPPQNKMPAGVPRVRALPNTSRKETARAWYIPSQYILCGDKCMSQAGGFCFILRTQSEQRAHRPSLSQSQVGLAAVQVRHTGERFRSTRAEIVPGHVESGLSQDSPAQVLIVQHLQRVCQFPRN